MMSNSNPSKPSYALIVDDDPEMRDTVAEFLYGKRVRPVTAGNVREAAMKIRNQRFDFVLLDLNLGEESGVDVAEQLRKQDRELRGHTPIVVMTGFAEKNLLSRLAGKIDGCVVKPFTRDEFLERVERTLAQAHKRPSVRSKAA